MWKILLVLICLGFVETASADTPDLCKNLTRDNLAPPKVFVYKVRRTNIPPYDRVRVSGTIEGACLAEAGYFERGHLEKKVAVKTTRDFERINFTVEVRPQVAPEIRVYNTVGDSDVYRVEVANIGDLPNYGSNYPRETQNRSGYYANKSKDYYATGPVSPRDRKITVYGNSSVVVSQP